MATPVPQPARPFSNGFLPNGAPSSGSSGPAPGAQPLLPNQGRIIQQGPTRVLCVADVRGDLRQLNQLAQKANADYIIHTGDFGFYDENSYQRIADKTLKHVAQYSPLISDDIKRAVSQTPPNASVKDRFRPNQLPLSQLPAFLSKSMQFAVPVYTVWGACEDVQVLEKLRSKEYDVPNLHIIDEAHSRLLDIGGIKLRLLGLGGAVVMHKLFDNGEGRTTIAGGQGTMWTTFLQMGELVDTANRVYDPSETRLLVTHASPAREGLLNQLAVALKVDFSISAGLHFRYGSSYNEFSVNPSLDHYRGKLAASKSSFTDVWETVRSEVEPAVQENEAQNRLLQNALEIVYKMPDSASSGGPFGGGPATMRNGEVDEVASKNMWNFNLADAAFGYLVLEVEAGRIGTEMRAQGFNFAHRGQKQTGPNDGVKATAPSPGIATPSAAPSVPIAPSAQGPPAQPRANVPPAAPAPGPAPAAAPQSRPTQAPRTQPTQQTVPSRPAQSSPAAPSAPATTAPKQPSPAPPAAANAPAQAPTPSTPLSQPKNAPSEIKTNGTTDDAAAVGKDTPSPAHAEQKPSQGIFITGVSSEEEARNLFSEEDRTKIERLETRGRAYVAHFQSPEDMQAVLKSVSPELRKPGGTNKPHVREYQVQRQNQRYNTWNPRGGASGPQGSGYRSGGASDSEGGRGGRGSFRGTRGRGDRGRGRGGRGGFGKGEGGAAGSPSSPAAPSPAPASGGAAA